MDCSIVSYGHFIPRLRLDMATLGEQWELPGAWRRAYEVSGRRRVAVNAYDEDTTTLALEAAERALRRMPPDLSLQAVVVGSESHPYAVKPTAGIVAEALDLSPHLFAADTEFACKGGTAALTMLAGLVASGQTEAALAIGADCPQGGPGSILEASVGSGAAAFVLARKAPGIASIDALESTTSDCSDFWRRDTEKYPRVLGKFSSDMGYVRHTVGAVEALLEKTGTRPEDYRFLCLHQPYQSLPLSVSKRLGFTAKQVRPSLLSGDIGNTYSAATLLGLCRILDQAEPGDRILLCSYGSGAGSDAFALTVLDGITSYRAEAEAAGVETVSDSIADEGTVSLTYGQYALHQGKLR